MAFGDILAKLGGGGGAAPGAPAPAAQGVGLGAPPVMPGLPPPPSGVGPIPTGDPGTTKKDALDNAVLALREATGHAPNLKSAIEAMIDSLKAEAQKDDGAPGLGSPSPPGSAPPNPPPPDLSGAPGAL
jgi:hypothetical protein